MEHLTFPFGQSVKRVIQADRSPKSVFILGAYGSAVHARWCNKEGKEMIRALAVASEPCIFWACPGGKGEVKEILSAVDVPAEAGYLQPAAPNLNGPSGRSIDEHYLKPLGLTRAEVWLCDLVPHSCKNPRQAEAVRTRYEPYAQRLGLPPVNWPKVPREFSNSERRQEIAAEIRESTAEVFITLGDLPLKWLAGHFGSERLLRAYGEGIVTYGRLHDFRLDGQLLKLLPLVHPRQAASLSRHTPKWKALHTHWAKNVAPEVLAYF